MPHPRRIEASCLPCQEDLDVQDLDVSVGSLNPRWGLGTGRGGGPGFCPTAGQLQCPAVGLGSAEQVILAVLASTW